MASNFFCKNKISSLYYKSFMIVMTAIDQYYKTK